MLNPDLRDLLKDNVSRYSLVSAVAKRALLNMEMTNRSYPFVKNPWDYAVTAGLVFAYIVFSHALSMRSLRKWDIVESVKDKE